MKKSLIALALMAAFAAHAQDTTVNSGSQSGSVSGANSGSTSAVGATNSGNNTATAIGNQAGAQSGSQSNSGATSGSLSGALGNVVNIDQRGPTSQTITSTGSNSTNLSGGTTNTDNVKYSGTIENRTSGGTIDTVNQNVHYSGTQTIKNVPGIAMSGPASGPCTGASGGVGVAGPGFGVGLNGAKVDDGCTVRENTRILGQLYQSLDSNNPAKAQAQAALMKSMAIIEAMNDKIGADYVKPQPAPKTAEAPVPSPAVATAPAVQVVATPVSTPKVEAVPNASAPKVALVAPPKSEPTDPYIRARMGLK